VRSTTTREALWTELDAAEMLALAEYRQSLCPLHHGPLEDCQTGVAQGGPEFTPQAIRCRAQYDVIAAQDTDSRMKDRPGSLLWLSVKKEA
jgi:hypothetical protein